MDKKELKSDFILHGNLWKVIIKLSLPLMLLASFNYIYGIIDTVIAAGISTDTVSAVVVLDQIKNVLSSVGAGLSGGAMIIVARLAGRNDYEKAKKVASTVVLLAAAVGLVSIAVILPLAPFILRLANVPSDLIDIGIVYFGIQIITVNVILFNGVFLGLEKSRGRTETILILNFCVIGLKIILSTVFVFGFKFGINMVAMSTLIANLCLTVYVIARLASKNYLYHFSFRGAETSRKFLSPIFFLSLPIVLGKFVFSLGKVIINAMCAGYGKNVVGALGVSNHLGASVTNVLASVEETTSLVVSTNLGEQNQTRAIHAFYYSLVFNVSLAVAGVILLTIFNAPIIRFFSKGDAEFGELINKIFSFEKMGIITLAINSSVLGLLYGFGYTRISMAINLSRLFLFRIPSLYLLMNFTTLGSESVGIAMLVSNGGIGIMSIVIALVYLRKIKKRNIVDGLKI